MLKTNELRLGNYVMYEQTTHVVTQISEKLIGSYWIGADPDPYKNDYITTIGELEPLTITENDLFNFGFKKVDGNFKYYVKNCNISNMKEFKILSTNSGLFYFIAPLSNSWNIELKYVHQLQNIFYYLTENELTYNNN